MQDGSDGMTTEERLRMTCEMHDLGVAMMRQTFRRRHPQVTDQKISEMLAKWLQTRPGAEIGDVSGPDFRVRPL